MLGKARLRASVTEFRTPPRLDRSNPSPGQHAERQKKRRALIGCEVWVAIGWGLGGGGRITALSHPSSGGVESGLWAGRWGPSCSSCIVVAVQSCALIVPSFVHCLQFSSILLGGRGNLVCNNRSSGSLPFRKENVTDYLPSCTREKARNLISSWLLMTFKAPNSQIPTTKNVSTSSSLPHGVSSLLASELSEALVKARPAHPQNFLFCKSGEPAKFSYL